MDDILASIRRIMLDEQARLQDGAGTPAYATPRAPATGAAIDPVLILDSSMVIEDMPGTGLAASRVEDTIIRPSSGHTEMPRPVDARKAADERDAMGGGTVSADAVPYGAAPADAAPADAPVAVGRGAEFEGSAPRTPSGAGGDATVGHDAHPQQFAISAQAMEALVAPAAAAAAAASVDALMKQLSEGRLAALHPLAPPPASPTLEDVVRSELRPFLKSWLDENMPPMVERIVRAEITRLIGRSGF